MAVPTANSLSFLTLDCVIDAVKAKMLRERCSGHDNVAARDDGPTVFTKSVQKVFPKHEPGNNATCNDVNDRLAIWKWVVSANPNGPLESSPNPSIISRACWPRIYEGVVS